MALYTRPQLCERLGINNGYINMYIKRGGIKITSIKGTDYIDDTIPENNLFISKRVKEKNIVEPETINLKNNESKQDTISATTLTKLKAKKELKTIERIEKEIEKLNLDNKKKAGSYLPVDQTIQVIIQLSEAIYQACENEMEERDRILVGELGLDREWGVKLRRGRIEAVNTAKEKAIKAAKVQIRRLQDQISDQRGRGEHD